MQIAGRSFLVRERDSDVDTGIYIQQNDRLVVEASGAIWAGVWFTGENGPEGWSTWSSANPGSPLPSTAPFCLLGKIGREYFYIGRRIDQTYAGNGGRLCLRINDDTPSNGSGEFTCNVRVYRDAPPILDQLFTIRESDRDVDTGIDVRSNDRLSLQAGGSIWAGVWFTGENGPEGWSNWGSSSRESPLPSASPFCLLGRLDDGYFKIGRALDRTYTGTITSRLYLRINDDRPANGSGAFTCRVQLYREAPPLLATFTGIAVLRTSHPSAPGPYSLPISIQLQFSGECPTIVRIMDFPDRSVSFDTPLGTNTMRITRASGGTGDLNSTTGEMTVILGLRFENSIVIGGTSVIEFNPLTTGSVSSAHLSATGDRLDRSSGRIRLVGAGQFREGFLNGYYGMLELDGVLAPVPG